MLSYYDHLVKIIIYKISKNLLKINMTDTEEQVRKKSKPKKLRERRQSESNVIGKNLLASTP